MMTPVIASRLCALIAVLVLAGAPAALADAPSRLAGPVTDRAGVLGTAGSGRVQQAVARLKADKGYDLFVVFVRSFDGAQPADWADRTATLSQLGRTDVLFAVATDDRAYHISYDQQFPLSESVTNGIADSAVEPRLSAGDWAAAAVALADGLRTSGGSDAGVIGTVALVGGLAVVGGGAYLLIRRRRRATASAQAAPPGPAPDAPATPTDEFAGVSTEDLAYRASEALLAVDDAVRSSEQELAAARAHFGDIAVARFAAALEESRAEMLQGFGLRQQLDDDVPEDEPTQRRMLAEIVRACRGADERLDAQVAAFDALRNLEATAPAYVAGLAERLAAAQARLPQADAAWAGLRTRWAAAALEPVAGNLDQARRLLAAAATEIDAARSALAGAPDPAARPAGGGDGTAPVAPGGDGAGNAAAVVSGRAAEDAITQAGTLLDALDRVEADLVAAGERIAAARAETEQDLAEARTLAGDGDPTGLAALVARAEAALAAAGRATAAAPPDPLAALRLIDQADHALDEGIGAARDARRASATLEQTLITARAAVGAADDFIQTRRGAVGTLARTRLEEAKRRLAAAEAGAGTDPGAATAQAVSADALARQAQESAQADVDTFVRRSGGGGTGGELGNLGGLVLGGILSGMLSGGGPRGGSGGGRGPGGFGGSASQGRRGGGGRF